MRSFLDLSRVPPKVQVQNISFEHPHINQGWRWGPRERASEFHEKFSEFLTSSLIEDTLTPAFHIGELFSVAPWRGVKGEKKVGKLEKNTTKQPHGALK